METEDYLPTSLAIDIYILYMCVYSKNIFLMTSFINNNAYLVLLFVNLAIKAIVLDP